MITSSRKVHIRHELTDDAIYEEGRLWLERKFRGHKVRKWTWGHADFEVLGGSGKSLHLVQMKYSKHVGGTEGKVSVRELVGILDEAEDHKAKACAQLALHCNLR